MHHFQVGSMGAKLLLIYVLCQTIITVSLGGVTLPYSDLIGKVTPIKPKPLSPSTICEIEDKLLSPSPGAQEFSSPLTLTSTSRALPVPKIDSISMADVKLPERLREKFVLPKLCCTSTTTLNAKAIPEISTPDLSLPYKYTFLSDPSKPSNSLPCSSSWDLSFNKISSLASMDSLPVVPIGPLKSRSSDILCTGSLPRSRTIDSPLALETRKPSFSEQFSSNTFSPLGFSSSLPSPLCYKSSYLPAVRTPSETSPIIFRPISYKGFNSPNQSGSHNLLSPKTFTIGTNVNSLQDKYNPCTSRHLNRIKTAEIPEPINPIQLPKTSSNEYVSTKPELKLSPSSELACNTGVKNLWHSLEANDGSASVAFLSSAYLKNQKNPFRNSMPNTLADKISDFKLKPCTCTLPKIKPPELKSQTNSPSLPFVPVSPSLPNNIKSFDCSKNIDRFGIIPIIGSCVETIERLNTNDDICSNCQIEDSRNVPRLEQINLSCPFAPKLASCQHPLFSQERVSKPIYSEPIIPCDPIPTISSTTSYSPYTFCPSTISQTPSISCISQSRPISVAQTTSNIVSSINDVVSNIAQNILSSYQSYINSSPQKLSDTITQSNPCDNLEFMSKQTLPILQLPVNTQSILPIIISPITDCINPPTVRIPTMSDASCQLSEYEMAASQSLPISLPQPTAAAAAAAAVVPPISLITFSSPQLCPSYLPSPTLPSYPTISSPFYMEAPVYKVSSSKKDSSMGKLIELMLLAEILNNDESFDWDDLDTLLAFLSLS